MAREGLFHETATLQYNALVHKKLTNLLANKKN
jgi:hypothetical protein